MIQASVPADDLQHETPQVPAADGVVPPTSSDPRQAGLLAQI